MGYRWQPLQRANIVSDEPPELIAAAMKLWNVSEAEARKRLEDEHQRLRTEYWVNDLYQVAVSHHPDNIIQLNIRRRDGAPCIRDWRHFQQIKNELVGEECEGVELYPAESRKVDTSNKYHLWCIADPAFRFPVGFRERDVVEHEVKGPPGMRQRGK
jgi:hypothetical protein